jgi:hypothetical protein
VALGHRPQPVLGEHELAGAPTKRPAPVLVAHQRRKRSRIPRDVVARLDEDARVGGDDLAVAGQGGRDHGQAHRHGLVEDVGHALEHARHEQRVARGVPRGELVGGRVQEHVVLEAALAQRALDGGRELAVADHVDAEPVVE